MSKWVWNEERDKGNAAPLIEWFNNGADGAISWGSPGDFEQCVAEASKHMDDPEGFCNLRHQDAVGGPPGSEDKSAVQWAEERDWAAWDAQDHSNDEIKCGQCGKTTGSFIKTSPNAAWQCLAHLPNLGALSDRRKGGRVINVGPGAYPKNPPPDPAGLNKRDWAAWDAEHGGKYLGTKPNVENVPVETLKTIATPGLMDAIRESNSRDFSGLKDQIKSDGGFKEPIIIQQHSSGTNEIIDGHHRLAAAEDLGISSVPATVFQPGKPDYKPSEAGIAIRSSSLSARIEQRARTVKGKPTRSAALAQRFRAPMVGAYQNKSAAQLKEVMQSLYVSSYLAGLQAATQGPGGDQISAGLQDNPDYANMLDDEGNVDENATDNVDTDNAPGKLGLLLAAVAVSVPNILSYMEQDGTPSPLDQAVQMTDTETAAGVEAGVQDGAAAGGITQMRNIPDDDACDECTSHDTYDVGDDGPPWHPRCGCESEPDAEGNVVDSGEDTPDTSDEGRSVLGKYVRRDWTQWDLEHPYVPVTSQAPGAHMDPQTVRTISESEARGNSRPVSQEEFNSLAVEGQSMLHDIQGDARPTTAFDDPEKFQAVKNAAFNDVQRPWGGSVIDPQTGKVQDFKDGYTLSVKQSGQPSVSIPENATKAEFDAAMDKAKTTFASDIQGRQTHLGVFHDDDLHRIDIDPVVHVDNTHDVETIGAATHAIGGAFDHATKDGVFPPHVPDSARKVNK